MTLYEYLKSYHIMTDAALKASLGLLVTGNNRVPVFMQEMEQQPPFGVSYTKTIELIENIMKSKFRNRNMYFTDTTTIQDDVIEQCITVLLMHMDNWNKKWNTLTLFYDPIQSVSIMEDTNSTRSSNEEVKKTGTAVNNGTLNNTGTTNNAINETTGDTEDYSKNTYDNSTMSNVDKRVNSGTNTSSNLFTDNRTSTNNNTLTNDLTDTTKISDSDSNTVNRNGHDIPVQDLIAKEREIAEYNFFEMIADELTDAICLSSYNYSSISDQEDFYYGL